MLRVIAGEFRGRRITAPEGLDTRPTADRVKESMMSALVSATGGFEGTCVLDAFAGSGALGIECLSRGADLAVFFDSSRDARMAVEANLKSMGIDAGRGRLVAYDVLKRPPVSPGRPFDVVLLDPPYAMPAAEVFDLVRRLAAARALTADAVVCYEHGASLDFDAEAASAGLAVDVRSRKRMRDVAYDIFTLRDGAASEKGD